MRLIRKCRFLEKISNNIEQLALKWSPPPFYLPEKISNGSLINCLRDPKLSPSCSHHRSTDGSLPIGRLDALAAVKL
jgi:hypothetical protein